MKTFLIFEKVEFADFLEVLLAALRLDRVKTMPL